MTSIDLSRPLDNAGAPVARLTIREPDIGALIAVENINGEMARLAALIAHLNDVPVKVVHQMRPSDFDKVVAALLAAGGNDTPAVDGATQPA
ncbi:conserved hypothetical protein [Hyphomicrobiales bacterium]|nr:conserved hypothetical protein [Hyphomicrobiales bacterium]CAH1673492.1 conserved hypothetical protein [Hyphomicrobiales bacterium]